jgi:hypothetical protein
MGSFFASAVNSAIEIAGDATAKSIDGECDRTLAVAAATMSRATVTAVMIYFVMETSLCPKSSGMAVRITSLR